MDILLLCILIIESLQSLFNKENTLLGDNNTLENHISQFRIQNFLLGNSDIIIPPPQETVKSQKYDECLFCDHKCFLKLLNKFNEKNQKHTFKYVKVLFSDIIKESYCYFDDMGLKGKFKNYIKTISKNIKITHNIQSDILIFILTIYFFLSCEHKSVNFWKNTSLKAQIIHIYKKFHTLYIYPLITINKSDKKGIMIKRVFTCLFLSSSEKTIVLNKSVLYLYHEMKLDNLHKEHDSEYDKSMFPDRANRIISLFFGKTDTLCHMISIMEIILTYDNPEILFIISFFYLEITGTRKVPFIVEKYSIDQAFKLCVSNRITLDILKEDTINFYKKLTICNILQIDPDISTVSERAINMEGFMKYLIEKYTEQKNDDVLVVISDSTNASMS